MSSLTQSKRASSSGEIRERDTLAIAAGRLRSWLERMRFAGIEPHDALTSPLLKRTPLGRSRLLRLIALQGLRRLPLNIRPLLGVTHQTNAISLGWALSAYAVIDDASTRDRIADCVDGLDKRAAHGFSGLCWGYYFDWQTRTDYKRADVPIVVSTAFIGMGLLDAYAATGVREYLERARSACDFILRDLNRSEHPAGFIFSYSPEDHEQVYNASILGAALLARVGAATGEHELWDVARGAVDAVVADQRPDGSWPYSRGDHRSFVDNFHTGYVLCALRDYIEATGDDRHSGALERGWCFYREHFFDDGEVPRYYHNQTFPIDAHAAAQSIVTLVRFGETALARRVALWTIRNMQTREGSFIYRIYRRHTNRIAYLRWSNAWMLYALAQLVRNDEKERA
ncbi:MAG: delta-aminolevulinic acid dehydratase [bacterium]|nr:delta-aminolevulinic acid dehydratase [Candidatus Kapabacteria bacterium]